MYTASRKANDVHRFQIGSGFKITGTPLKLRWLKGEFVTASSGVQRQADG